MSKRRRSEADDEVARSVRKRNNNRIVDSEGEAEEEESESEVDENDDIIESSLREPAARGTSSKLKASPEPVAGVIKRVSMHNFMCHNRLEVVLGSHVNFIVGRNGSGKSAVLTALVVGLGGKASATSRGSSIKNFVKTGKRSAWVEVVLNNKGKDSYKPHIYGDKIVVTRRFSAEGASSYNIKGDKGQHISNRSSELHNITDHLNIQVDNPVSVLNQDTSRNFLNTKSAGDKFKFFMKATQLEQMSSNYDEVRRKTDGAKLQIQDKEQILPKMKAEVRVWETKFKNMTAISELKVKVKQLKHEMAWALVNQKERGLRPMEKALNVEVEALPRFEKKVQETQSHHDEWDERHKQLQAQMMECSDQVRSLEPELQEGKRQLGQAKERLQPLAMELKLCDRELTITKRDCSQCQERINELRTTASHDYEAEREAREEALGQFQAQMDAIVQEQRVKEHELGQFREAVARGKSDLILMEKQVKDKDTKLRETNNLLTNLRHSQSDKLKKFGPHMPALVDSIKKNKARFHKVPVGPLGACFELQEPKWALAVENCLKGLVSSFVCHDHHDEQILLNLCSVCPKGKRPTIIISPFRDVNHDVSRNRVQSDRYLCMLDVIKYENPVVMNTLIDQRTLERVCLIEDESNCRRVMQSQPPHNTRETFTLQGDQCFGGPTFRYYSNDNRNVRFLGGDVAAQIISLEAEYRRLQEEKADLVKQREVISREISRNQQEEKKLMTQSNKLKERATRIKFDMSELSNVEDPLPVDVTTLEEEVQGFKQKILELQERRIKVIEEKGEAEGSLREVKERLALVEASIREKSDSGIPLREEITQALAGVEKARSDRKHYTGKLRDQEQQIEGLRKEIDKYKFDLEADKGKATQICPFIATKRTDGSIENEITQITRRITEEEREHGNEKEIIDTYTDKKKTYERSLAEIRGLKNYLHKLDQVMDRRQQAYLRMRKEIASRTKYYFIVQLHQRKFTGKMHFDFTKQTLDILVNPSQEGGTDTTQDAKDLKSLSGGERSFSTVCYILSLWEAMEAPFRCLDEFDVFMDMVNRRVTMEMMMETCTMHRDMQFVFLTPQDMSFVQKIDNHRIFRMPDPERTQKTLNFSQDDN